MSHIPNAAIPHAGPAAELEAEAGGQTLMERASTEAGRIVDLARDNPRTAMAAGAAVAAGVVAAAAIPLVRAARRKSDGGAKAPARKRSTGTAKKK